MIALVILAVLLAWVVVSAITAVVCGAVARGALQEDRARGYLVDRP
jgi:hypothetical protein